MVEVIKREFTAEPKDTVIVLECCECGAKEDVALKEYFGNIGVCGQCDKMENYMMAVKVKVSVALATV